MTSKEDQINYIRTFADDNNLTASNVENMLCKIWVVRYSELATKYKQVDKIKWS
jgi:hypothetical protein